ncbi:hypothetical protein ES703_84212 [subsurface metagenome]
MPYRRRKYVRKRRPTHRRRYRRHTAAKKVQRAVRAYVVRKKARRKIVSYARRRLNSSMNSLANMSKTTSFSSYLERHMCPADNWFVDDTNISTTPYYSAGILCGSKNTVSPSFRGQLQLALRCGPGGFFDASVPVSNFRPINSRVDDVMSQWKSFRIKSTTWTFEPVGTGRQGVDAERNVATVSSSNGTSAVDYKNLLCWFVIDQGNREINANEIMTWSAPLSGTPPVGLTNSGKLCSLGSDTANLCDTSVKRRLCNSSDRKTFKFTIYPPKKESPLYQFKNVVRGLTSAPQDYLRPGAWAQCDDWTKFFTGAWSSAAELPNNAAFGSSLGQVAPLSISMITPVRFDANGVPVQVPMWRVSVKQVIEFKGLRST